MNSLLIDAEKCNRCGICTEECPAYLVRLTDKEALPSWVRGAESWCLNCGHCVAICPTGALELSSMPVAGCIPIVKELQPSPEQVEQLLKSRRVIRAYREEPVEREKLAKLLDIARYAPSGHNAQPVNWLVIENREKVKELAQLVVDWLRDLAQQDAGFARMLQAKALVKAWESGSDRITRVAPHLIITHAREDTIVHGDCHIALAYLELAAYSMGIGTCWSGYVQLGATHSPALLQALQLPEGHDVFGAMLIGYPQYKFTRIPVRNEAKVTWR
ncbi:nitroreductase family protein [Chloroflexota bacterium]